jgi:hyperosmotically inducible periplasmic protein
MIDNKMNKFSLFILSSFLMLGAAACTSSQTSQQAPASTQDSPQAVNKQEAQEVQDDGTSETRRNQANSDIRAREQRNNALNNGQAMDRDDDDLASEVRSKLETNLPASALVVDSEDGIVTISGTVPTQEQLNKIATLAKDIKGVQTVNVTAKVAPAQPTSRS